MTIDEMVASYKLRKGDTAENVRKILEIKQETVRIQEANGEKPRISLEKHFQRMVDNETDASLESLRTHTRILGTVSEQYGIPFEWPTDWR